MRCLLNKRLTSFHEFLTLGKFRKRGFKLIFCFDKPIHILTYYARTSLDTLYTIRMVGYMLHIYKKFELYQFKLSASDDILRRGFIVTSDDI